MSEERCEPPEGVRHEVGHHMLERTNMPYSVCGWWNPALEGWRLQGVRGISGWTSPREAWLQGYRYLCPIPTPSDLAAAKEREKALERELAFSRAMQHAPDTYARLARELYKAVAKHTDEPDILSIIGSWRDTLPDQEILEMLIDYNESGKALHDVQ